MSKNQYILVASEKPAKVLKDKMKEQKDIEFSNIFYSIKSLINSLNENGSVYLKVVKGILVLDYGFERPDPESRAKEFLQLQDMLVAQGLRHQDLYLYTKDKDLYLYLRDRDINGISAIYYKNTQVFIAETKITYKSVMSVLRGELDMTGLYHPEYGKKTLADSLEESSQLYLQNIQAHTDEIKNYGKTQPITEFSKTDFVDNPAFREKLEREKREKEKEERIAKRKTLEEEKRAKNQKQLPQKEEKKGNTIIIQNISDPSKVVPMVDSSSKSALITDDDLNSNNSFNLEKMRAEFSKLNRDNALIDKKLQTDSGVIFVTGESKSGVSGFVANSADMYGIAQRRVLIIDLDVNNRSQTLYYPVYDTKVRESLGRSKGLVDTVKGSALNRSAVQITRQVSILGISRKEDLLEDVVDDLSDYLSQLIEEAKESYDIILIDCPLRYMGYYIDDVLNFDKSIFVFTNKWYSLETFLHRELLAMKVALTDEEFNRLMRKSSIVLNQFKKSFKDLHGQEVNQHWVKDVILGKGYPYDLMSVAGEIPYYDEWENQYSVGLRQVFTDKVTLGLYSYIWSKIQV